MTAAQKTAKANFKKAIEYRKKTGVSLKEAFAHVYGKKVGAAPKKKAAKKAAPKKSAKKVVKKAAPKKVAKKAAPKKKAAKKIGYSKIRLKQQKGITKVLRSTPKTLFPYTEEEKIIKAGKKYFDEKSKELSSKGLAGLKKKSAPKKHKPIKEQSILNKIHKVKDQVSQLDELQHKHMSKIGDSSYALYNNVAHKIENAKKSILYAENHILRLKSFGNNPTAKKSIKMYKDYIKEHKQHITQLKKYI